jgi:hypothetical protein
MSERNHYDIKIGYINFPSSLSLNFLNNFFIVNLLKTSVCSSAFVLQINIVFSTKKVKLLLCKAIYTAYKEGTYIAV